MIDIIVPIIVFVVLLLFTLWLRRLAYGYMETRFKSKSSPKRLILTAIRAPLTIWCILISLYLPLAFSSLSSDWKEFAERGIWTLFLLSAVFLLIYLAGGIISYYGQKRKISSRVVVVASASADVVVIVIGLIVLWYIWSTPGNPLAAVITGLSENWTATIIPTVIFIFALIALLWLRRLAHHWLARWSRRLRWDSAEIILQVFRSHSIIWSFLFSVYMALVVSGLSADWKDPVVKVLWTLFVASVTTAAIYVVSAWFTIYGEKWSVPRDYIVVLRNTTRIIILVVMVLVVMEMWGLPTSPIILLIVVLVLAAILAFRDVVPNIFAGFQLSATQQIKVGDYIKLETGEEGYVLEISWNNTRIKSLGESIVIIPNSRLVKHAVINYGRPLKRASEPFRFNTRTHLTELTGLKARNLRELADVLSTAPDAVVYYHTHHFLEQHYLLTPEPSNDFALWVGDALGDEVLCEALASVDTFEFPSLSALRDRLVFIMNEYIGKGNSSREAMEGRAFYFMKSVSVILPTAYAVYDLREFVEALRKISVGSLYFHMFESRLRLGRGFNDFSVWLEKSLGDPELGKEIAQFDPYTYTLEGLRLALIQTIEKRIK